ncbi:M56 family metallopeptidase [Saccharothrix saharensis]|uniref:M56 family metallopeptidase n=1 Tax=Saccharothrix saharensis TaxID=571190 RepID=UPI0036C4F158
MTVAVALLLGAWLVSWLAPRQLRRLSATGADPRVTLAAWLSSAVSVMATVGLAVTVLLLPDHGSRALATIHDCLASMAHGSTPRVEAITGAIGMLLLAAMLGRFAIVSARAARRRARKRREHMSVLRLAGRKDAGCPDTLWLAHEEPLAFSLAGSPGIVVATDGLLRSLTDQQVNAVLAHERAHLRGRHHLLVAAGDALATVFPFLPLFRSAPEAVRELVELAADAAAARVHGAEAVRTALTRVTGCGVPGSALAMSRDAVEIRLAHLRHADRPRGVVRTAVSWAVTELIALALPPAMALGSMSALVALSCF